MQIIQSKLFNQFSNLTHAFTTQEIGNIAFHVNDAIENVENNHSKLAKLLKYDKQKLIHMKQIHSNDVYIVNAKDNFTTPPTCDALVTNKIQTPLMVMVADCSPILFYDAKEKVIAVAHAGRQGAFKNIIAATLLTMQKEFQTELKNVYVNIGASIGKCCYEVGTEIYEEAIHLKLEYAVEKKKGSYYLDIKKILLSQLQECGIEKKKIEISQDCTCCLRDTYYSYRANPQIGRFAGVIMLR
jgi:polyphenol oxidase